jgi:hypothetical protein
MKRERRFVSKKLVLHNSLLLLFTQFLMLSGCGSDSGAGKATVNGKQGMHSFSFAMERNKTILTARVGNSLPLRVLLDSGMGMDGILIYNPDLKDSIQLENAVETAVPGAGKGKPSTALMADSMSYFIGNMEFRNQPIVVLQNDIYRGFPSDGVVGYSLFGHYAVEINYDDLIITLHHPDSLAVDTSWTQLPMELRKNNIPWTEATVAVGEEEPVTMSMYIDYASGEALELLVKPGMKFTLPENTKEAYLGRGLSGDIFGKRGRAGRVVLAGYEFNDVATVFAPAEVRSKQQGADGILGNDIFRRFNVIFDYAHQQLYLKPNSHFLEPF